MSGAVPELIFVAGPQQGERAVIMTSTALVGRSPNAEVRLTEEAASREHVRFQFTHDGWVMENLSANGTVVNGKRYKRDKKIILDTGDVMGIGLETKILYVAPGDDAEDALQAWRAANPSVGQTAQPLPTRRTTKPVASHGSPAATAAPPSAPSAPAGKPPIPPKTYKTAASAPEAAEEPAEPGLEEEPEQQGSKKLKIILLSVVLLGVVGFGFVLMFRPSGTSGTPKAGLGSTRLTNEQIREALDAPYKRPLSPTQAAAALESAVRKYSNKELWGAGDLFLCVKQFKLYLAFSGSPSFPKVQQERAYREASKELEDMVCRRYQAAWISEKAKSYRDSKESFEALMRELPAYEVEREGPIDRVILKDVKEHIMFANRMLGKVP